MPVAKTQKELCEVFSFQSDFINYILECFGMRLPRRADSPNYFLLVSAAIICIFHLAGIDVAGGVFLGGEGFNFVSTEIVCYLEDGPVAASARSDFSENGRKRRRNRSGGG